MFLPSLRDFGFVVHPSPAMNRWAIIASPYGTRLLLNTSGLSEKAPPFLRGNSSGVAFDKGDTEAISYPNILLNFHYKHPKSEIEN